MCNSISLSHRFILLFKTQPLQWAEKGKEGEEKREERGQGEEKSDDSGPYSPLSVSLFFEDPQSAALRLKINDEKPVHKKEERKKKEGGKKKRRGVCIFSHCFSVYYRPPSRYLSPVRL